MKKSDWTMIIFVAVITGFVSFLITHSIMGSESKPTENVKTSIVFSNVVDKPNPAVFRVDTSGNSGAINPTVPITTGNGGNKTGNQNGDSQSTNGGGSSSSGGSTNTPDNKGGSTNSNNPGQNAL